MSRNRLRDSCRFGAPGGGYLRAILHNPSIDSGRQAWREAIARVGYRLRDVWNLRGPFRHARRTVCTMSLTTVMLRVLADGVGQYGVSVDELVRGTAVLPELFGRPDGFVRRDEFEPLLCRAVALTGDDAFGLHWAERSSFAAFDLLGHVAAAVPTFADALAIIIHMYPLLSDGHELALRLEDHAATLEFSLPRCAPPSSHVREEFIVASSLRLLRRFAGSSGMPSSAHFTYAAPAHRSEYTRYFGGVERFDQPFTGMVVDRKLLDARQLCHDEELERDLRVRAEARLQRSTATRPVREAGEGLALRASLRRAWRDESGCPWTQDKRTLSPEASGHREDELSKAPDGSAVRAGKGASDRARPSDQGGRVLDGILGRDRFPPRFQNMDGDDPSCLSSGCLRWPAEQDRLTTPRAGGAVSAHWKRKSKPMDG